MTETIRNETTKMIPDWYQLLPALPLSWTSCIQRYTDLTVYRPHCIQTPLNTYYMYAGLTVHRCLFFHMGNCITTCASICLQHKIIHSQCCNIESSELTIQHSMELTLTKEGVSAGNVCQEDQEMDNIIQKQESLQRLHYCCCRTTASYSTVYQRPHIIVTTLKSINQ